ncbi:hypothetical protein O181_041269 [Austropuccinia psidii MF-1]|uniref:Uncharacterized protein n=1 Tax=Austropuccinia psidii MF-1 TaxID=1389203 RepID=A0A9Q3DE32_9BASI|nr:hypothetical protein [Austropuccinia psidii MF-1]
MEISIDGQPQRYWMTSFFSCLPPTQSQRHKHSHTMANVFNEPPNRRGGFSPRNSSFKMNVNILCQPSFALTFALYLTFFSHLNQVLASEKVDCTEFYSISAAKDGRATCAPYDGQWPDTYSCDPKLCSKPVLFDCHPDPPRRSRKALPVNPTLRSYIIYSDKTDYIFGYEGPWPSPNTPENKLPPRFRCRRRGSTPAICQSCTKKKDW